MDLISRPCSPSLVLILSWFSKSRLTAYSYCISLGSYSNSKRTSYMIHPIWPCQTPKQVPGFDDGQSHFNCNFKGYLLGRCIENQDIRMHCNDCSRRRLDEGPVDWCKESNIRHSSSDSDERCKIRNCYGGKVCVENTEQSILTGCSLSNDVRDSRFIIASTTEVVDVIEGAHIVYQPRPCCHIWVHDPTPKIKWICLLPRRSCRLYRET